MKEIYIYNTKTKKNEIFTPIQPGEVLFYSCGPTVYDFIHIGNLRGALVADLIFRTFDFIGYKVRYVRNYTDIDDKIIDRANEQKISWENHAYKYIQEVEKDFALAGLKEPTLKTKATEFIPQMIDIIQRLVDKGFAYVLSSGEVLFDVSKFEKYGELSKKNLEDLVAGIRVEVRLEKRNPSDFTLWKPSKLGEPSWESPWCPGRPGWHIECSAMIEKALGPQIDIHHGGEDLVFPHHENEIAQSECSSGKAPFSRYWIHHAFVTVSQEKMSKSLGNVFKARDFLAQYHGEVARYLFFSVHYRSGMDFTQDACDLSIKALERIYEAKKIAEEILKEKRGFPDPVAETYWGEWASHCLESGQKILNSICDDFATPAVFAELFTLIRLFNHTISLPRARATSGAILGAQAFLDLLNGMIGPVLGIGMKDAQKALNDLQEMKKSKNSNQYSDDDIEKMILARNQARLNKDFAEADRIRKDLDQAGVLIKDHSSGTSWSWK